MRLTRRDAVAALASAGILGGGAVALAARSREDTGGDVDGETATERESDGTPAGPIDEDDLATLTAVAEVVYPSEVDGIEAFVAKFVTGRADARPDHAAEVADAVAYLDEWTESWYGSRFVELDADERSEALSQMGVDGADPDPGGSNVERVRYYVVNDLLFALYASPTGGELVGIENPQGHPGGTDSYQRGP
jgi:hypothetical protein